MIAMRLAEAATALNAVLHGGDVAFRGVGTDTRTLEPGQLFVALKGPRFDAHELLGEAHRRGAAAAVVEHEAPGGLPTLKVASTRHALGALAAHWRRRFGLPLIAVTGSNGKTTAKEMLAAILGLRGAVLATRGNLNNDIGVPLTLFGLGEEHRYAVIEMGANHPGEIAYLCGLAQPTLAAITLCAPAHLEGFGSVEGVARAKAEIVGGLPGAGIAVLNADDPYFALWREIAGARRVLGFGLRHAAEVTARLPPAGAGGENRMTLRTPQGEIDVVLPLPGRHNVMNALLAAACACALGIDLAAIGDGLQAMRTLHGRLEILAGRNGSRLIDDTYNANPASVAAALEVLAGFGARRWLVLGDMAELGSEAEALHRQVGATARALGVERLFAYGGLAAQAARAFGAGGRSFDEIDPLLQALAPDLDGAVTVLVKGSRSMRMERVVAAMAAAPATAREAH